MAMAVVPAVVLELIQFVQEFALHPPPHLLPLLLYLPPPPQPHNSGSM
jgi:hypothetical protein